MERQELVYISIQTAWLCPQKTTVHIDKSRCWNLLTGPNTNMESIALFEVRADVDGAVRRKFLAKIKPPRRSTPSRVRVLSLAVP